MDPRLQVKDFRFFQALAEDLHFGRAAKRLCIAQPHLSQHIRELEDRLDAKLLDRTTRAVRLTPAGEKFLERAQIILAQIEEATESTRRVAEGRREALRIGFTSPTGLKVVPWVLREFRRICPDTEIVQSNMVTAKLVRELLEGRIHYGFVRLPVRSRRLATQTLDRERTVVALSQDHPLAARQLLRLEDLADQDFIYLTPVVGVDFQEHIVDFQEHILGYCNRAGFSPRLTLQAEDTVSALVLVAAGYGVAILPEWVGSLSISGVILKPLQQIPAMMELAAAWVSEECPPVNPIFRDAVNRYIQTHPLP